MPITARELRSRYGGTRPAAPVREGYIAIPAQFGVACPRCGATNKTGDDFFVKLVTDTSGSHLECRYCWTVWQRRAPVKEGQP